MKKIIFSLLFISWAGSAVAQDVDTTQVEPEIFEMQDGDTTYVMQKYFMFFLKTGEIELTKSK